MCDINVFLQLLCLLQWGYEVKSWKNFDIAKQNIGKIKPFLITTQNQLKQKIVFMSRATSFTSNHRVYKLPASTAGGTDWGSGTILGTLPLLCSMKFLFILTYWVIRTWPFPKFKDPRYICSCNHCNHTVQMKSVFIVSVEFFSIWHESV